MKMKLGLILGLVFLGQTAAASTVGDFTCRVWLANASGKAVEAPIKGEYVKGFKGFIHFRGEVKEKGYHFDAYIQEQYNTMMFEIYKVEKSTPEEKSIFMRVQHSFIWGAKEAVLEMYDGLDIPVVRFVCGKRGINY